MDTIPPVMKSEYDCSELLLSEIFRTLVVPIITIVMKRGLLIIILISSILNLSTAQRANMELTYSGVDVDTYVQLDSIKVINRTQGGDTTLFWPDTVLILDYQVGMPSLEFDLMAFEVFQNYPNPVVDQTTISLYVPEKDKVCLLLTDILGRTVLQSEKVLDQGLHSFSFTPGSDILFFFNAYWRDKSSSVKMVNVLNSINPIASLEYIGSDPVEPQQKVIHKVQNFSFGTGDALLYIGYTNVSRNTLESGIIDNPENSSTYTFQFASDIPCPETPTVDYEGQLYNTVQIFSQCWLKENLNVGTKITGYHDMTNNGILEKYCYNNSTDHCTQYGGLYQWLEVMQYVTVQGSRGICPIGWHIPTDEEFKILGGIMDSQYSIGSPEWDEAPDQALFLTEERSCLRYQLTISTLYPFQEHIMIL